MDILNVLKSYDGKKLKGYPQIVYSSLYKKVLGNAYLEFKEEEDGYLFSPLYTPLRGEAPELTDFVTNNEVFLDSLKEYIINSLFAYSAIIEENSYYLTNPQSIVIMRLINKEEAKFEVKFYSHYHDELMESYDDKLYLGRDLIDLEKFERRHLGLEQNFASLVEQNEKFQERAKLRLRYLEDFQKPYLDEISYLIRETTVDALERIAMFPQAKVADIPKIKLNDVLDSILYIHNLLVELRDFTYEFEDQLRLREEHKFVKYLTKFTKDIKDDIRYLRKLSFHIHLKISSLPI